MLMVSLMSSAYDVKIADKINIELDDRKNYEFKLDTLNIINDLKLNDTVRFENVYNTYGAFCKGMKMAGHAKTETERIGLIYNSIEYALRNMEIYLNKRQYKRFLFKLNKDLYDNGFFEECYGYCQRFSIGKENQPC